MKLVMVTTYATPSNMRRELLEAVVARGHRVTVASPEPAAAMQGALAALGGTYRQWPVDRTGIDPVEDLRSAHRLHSILRDERPDVMLVYQIKAVLIAPLAAKLARVERVVPLVNGLGAVFDSHGFGATRKARLARRAYGRRRACCRGGRAGASCPAPASTSRGSPPGRRTPARRRSR